MENTEYLFKREGCSYDLSSPRIYIEIDRRNVDDRRQSSTERSVRGLVEQVVNEIEA